MIRSRLAALLVVVALALVVAPIAGADLPITWQGIPNGPVEADSPNGLSTLTITASDAQDDLVGSVVCLPGPPYPIGTTAVVCGVDDTMAGLQFTNFNVTVQDTTPPTITVPGTITTPYTSTSGAPVSYSVTASDVVDPSPSLSCTPASGSTFPLGPTTVTCNAQDASGNASSASFTVDVVDTTPPALTVPGPITTAATGPSGAVVAFAPTAVDAIDPSPTVACNPQSGSTFPLGTTTVSCTATDNSGNQANGSFTVTVTDTVPPVIDPIGNITAEATSANGATVTYTATATDAIDPHPTVVCSPASGSTFPLGPTTVTCNAHDASGNQATPVSFTVTVQDTTPPTIAPLQNITTPATSGSGAAVAYSATASDLVDGAVTPSCGPIASGGSFPIGMTTITCTATDAHHNSSSASFTVTVTATTPPTFSTVPGTLTYEANGPGGAAPLYTPPTATDAFGVAVPVTCAPAPGTLIPLGRTTVTCTATDTHGNTSTATFAIDVVDTTPPTLTVPQPIAVGTAGNGVPASAAAIAAFLAGATAQDLVDPAPTITNDAPAVFPIGTTTVTFTATDAAGNAKSATSTVTIVQQAPNSPPPPAPPPVDRTPPGDVSGVTAAVGAGNRIILSWTAPSAPDFDHVVVVRGDPSGAGNATVYSGNATSFVDASVVAGTEYRYVLTAYDHAGNASAGVALLVKPSPAALTSPLAGAKVAHAPLLAWAARPGTTYYNVQLYRGATKILSLWPAAPHVQLPKKWKFNGHRYTLTSGTYTWYVWPGVGPRSAKRYGAVLGQSTFVVG